MPLGNQAENLIIHGLLTLLTEQLILYLVSLPGQLMVKEAGGLVEKQDINKVLYNGGRVIAATPAVFERIKHFTERAMSD